MFVTIKPGFELHYEMAGEGPPVLFLPGILGDCSSFAPIVGMLKSEYCCISVEFAGQGATDASGLNDAEDFTIERHTEAIERLVDHLGLDRYHLVGLSFGSVVACRLARLQAGRVDRLALLGALLTNTAHHYRNWNAVWGLASHDDETFARVTLGLVYSEGFWQRYPRLLDQVRDALAEMPEARRRAFRWNLAAAAAYPGEAEFQSLARPLRCIHGSEDLIHPLAPLRQMVRGSPQAELVELEGVGHGLHVEAPRAVAESLRALFRG